MNLSPVARSRTFSCLVFLGLALGVVLPASEARADYFYTVTPCRAFDSRPGKADAPQLDANSKRTIKLTERCGVPADASAIAANVTVVAASGEGHIVVFAGPAGQSQPNPPVSTIPFRRQQTVPARANNVFIPLAGDGSGTANILPVMVPPGAKLGVIIDVVGFFRRPPIAQDDTATVAEDSGATTIDVRANDLAAGAPPFSITSVTQPANGTVAITNGGADLSYTPNADYCNTPPGTTLDTFTYTLTPTGSTATVSVSVTCEDDDPTAVDDTATVAENDPATPIDVLANDDNADGGPISITSVTQPANGTVAITNGGADLTYQPNAGYCNTPPGTTLDTFTYTLTPGGSTATVSVAVTCSDDDPTAVNDTATVAEDSGANTINVLANDTDPDGGPISIASVTQPANGTVVITNGGADLTYTPNADYCNTPPGTTLDTFTYTLTPGGSTATVTVTVTCGDDAPVAVDDAATVAEDSGATAIDVLANDTDNDGGAISIQSVTQPANGTVVITGGGTGLTYAPNANYCNTPPGTTLDTFTYTLTPGGDSATVTMTVTCEEDDPVAVNDAATVVEDSGANAIDVLANDTDVDGGAKSVSAVTQPANGTVAITGGGTGVSYTPNANYCNTPPGTTLDTFTYTLTPGGSIATVTVSVTCVDDDPVAVADAATVAEDSGANAIDVLANDTDIDAGPKSVSAVTQPANGTVVITGGGTGVSYTPNANYCNTPPGTTLDTFTYTLTPGGTIATVTVTVTCVDDNPTAVADAATVAEDSGANAIDVLANDTDPDGGAKSVQSVTQPANGTVAITGGGTGVSYTPNANYCNTPPGTTLDTFTYTLTPGGSSTTVTVSVTCVDDDPTAVADSATVLEDSAGNAIDVLANDTDPDGGPKSVTSVTQPANGTVAITGGGTGVSYTPNANYCNLPPGTTPDTFTYTIAPGGSSAAVSVSVTCVDDPPTAVNDTALVNEDSGANAINVLANDTDPDGGPISITSVTQPANGTVVITGGGTGLTYAPSLNYCNLPPGTPTDNFTYTLTPGGSSATVAVQVQCINDVPQINPATLRETFHTVGNTAFEFKTAQSLTPGVWVAGKLLDHFLPDPDGPAPLSASLVSSTPGAEVVIAADGSFSYIPAPGATGSDTFTYRVTDGLDFVDRVVTINLVERVWYVRNNAAAGGDGQSDEPFDTLVEAQTASGPNDFIFVYEGDGTNLGHTAGIVLKNGQRLLGEHTGLSVPVPAGFNGAPAAADLVLVAGVAGNRPLIGDAAGNGVSATDAVPVLIAGVNVAASGNAIHWTTAAGFAGTNTGLTIRDVVVRSAGGKGVNILLQGTGALLLAFRNNDLTSTGTGLDIQETGTGSLTITDLLDNQVNGNTGGTGINIANAIFDSVPGGGVNNVNGNTLLIGTLGNGVGGSGVVMTGVQGSLSFGTVSIYADGGAGLRMAGTAPGMTFGLTVPGMSVVEATGGPAVDISSTALTLPLASLRSTNSPSTGVALNSLAASSTFSAGSGSTISGISSAAGTAFQAGNNTNSTISYAGTITTTQGKGVDLTTNTGSTISFTGTLTLSSGTNTAFNATGGGTVTTTDTASTLTSTTGTALNVANTTIGAGGLRFRSISANGAASGIVLNTTGSSGGLTVGGDGGGSNNGSGGTIQNTSGAGISLTSTANVSLGYINITNSGTDGISINNINGFSLNRSTIIDSTGTAPADKGIDVGNFSTGTAVNGAINITNSVIGPVAGSAPHDSLAVGIGSGTSTWNVSNNTFRNTGNSAINLELRGTAVVNSFDIDTCTFAGAGSAVSARGVFANTLDDSVMSLLTIENSTFTNNNIHIDVNQQNDTDPVGGHTFAILNNTTMTGANSHAMNIFAAAGAFGGPFTGTIEGNTIGNSGVAGSGSAIGNGIRVNINGGSDATIELNNNTIRQTPNGRGIEIIGRNGTGGLDVTVTNNNVNPQAVSNPLAAILVQSNCLTTCNTVRTDVRGNTVPSGTDVTDLLTTYIALVESSTSTLELVDTTAPISGTCASELAATNTGSTGVLGGCTLIAGPISTP